MDAFALYTVLGLIVAFVGFFISHCVIHFYEYLRVEDKKFAAAQKVSIGFGVVVALVFIVLLKHARNGP